MKHDRTMLKVAEQTPHIEKSHAEVSLAIRDLNAYYGKSLAVEDITIQFYPNTITALIGPSGCGKSTVLRCLNRMHEVTKDAYVTGEVLLNGENIYAPRVDPVRIRRRIGMVFQKPNPFPMMSVYDNVIAGFKLNRGQPKGVNLDEIVEKALRAAALWDEVKDKLNTSGAALSGGQQQRLCIARSIAVEPEVVLMDEPCSALDPISTLKIEELMQELVKQYTIVLVTHNLQQAVRVAERTAFLLADEHLVGHLIEYNTTQQIFDNPSDSRTADYITGRFG
jgi:phosphate transport system ATP-binding protein